MKKIAIAAAALLILAACQPTEEEKQNLQKALPEGCVAHEVGSYGSIDQLLIIECTARHVTSTYSYMHQQHGKTSETDRAAVFVIEG